MPVGIGAEHEAFPPVNVIWATPAGRSLVARLPDPFAGKLVCPAIDGKLVPQDLIGQAQALIGTPKMPMPGSESAELAAKLATQNPKAAPADVANALIGAYCSAATAAAPLERPQAAARSFGFVEGFGQQSSTRCNCARSRAKTEAADRLIARRVAVQRY
jgi:hypothetical protein